MILGTPFFRTTVLSFDYYNNTIGVWTKIPNSPIVPGSDSISSDKLSAGAIAGISIGSFIILLLIVLLVVYFSCRGKTSKEKNYAEVPGSIQAGEDDL